jgi:hypothetical protein
MPCALKDVGNATTEVMGDPPKDIAYQPLHVLPGFKFAAEAWAAKGLQDKHDLTELPINLLAGFTGSWHDLGFDSGKVLDKVFQRGSQKYKKIENTIQGWKMTLRYTEMRSFEVNRGLWYVEDTDPC